MDLQPTGLHLFPAHPRSVRHGVGRGSFVPPRFARLKFNAAHRVSQEDPPGLQMVRGCANGAILEVPNGWVSVTLALDGWLHASSQAVEWSIPRGRVLVWDSPLQLRSFKDASWLTLCGTPEAWVDAGACGRKLSTLFPDEAVASRHVARHLIHLARASRGGPAMPETGVGDLIDRITGDQDALRLLMQRCTGRTQQNRRRMLLRLLKLRHIILAHPDRSLDMAMMSRLANYSVWHLARSFRMVFGMTLSEFSIHRRLEHALELVRHTSMPFADIAEATGFECQSSFSRAFRRCYGTTPTLARTGAAPTHARHSVPGPTGAGLAPSIQVPQRRAV